MNFNLIKDEAIACLAHSLEWRTGDDLQHSLRNIQANYGDVIACKGDITILAEHQALYAYYALHDLIAFRQWIYVAAKVRLHILPYRSEGYSFLRFWMPLMSNHPALIEHVAWYPERYLEGEGLDFSYLYKKRQEPRHDQHQRWMLQLAIRSDWDNLHIETTKALSNIPKSMKKHDQLDYRYLHALANRDLETMQEIIAELLTPRMRSVRNDLPVLEDLVSLDALVLTKIAWLNGINFDPQSDYIPLEWLSMTPNTSYHDPYDFMGDIQLL